MCFYLLKRKGRLKPATTVWFFLGAVAPCCKKRSNVLEFAASGSPYDDAIDRAATGYPTSFPARARPLAYKAFTVVFYGSKIFDRKTAQLSETLRESGYLVSTSKNRLRNMAKTGAKSLS